MRATGDNGRFWDRWRARDYGYRSFTIFFWMWVVLGFALNETLLGAIAFMAFCTASIHERLADITASIHSRFDEQTGRAL